MILCWDALNSLRIKSWTIVTAKIDLRWIKSKPMLKFKIAEIFLGISSRKFQMTNSKFQLLNPRISIQGKIFIRSSLNL